MRRFALALVVLLAFASPALGDDVSKKHHVDQRISTLNTRVAQQKQQEQALRSSVAGYTARIRALEARVGDVSLRLSTLQADLRLHERRLTALTQLYRLQTERFRFLQAQYRQAVHTLDRRIVALYESGDVTTLDVVLGARDLDAAIDEVQYVQQLSRQDKHIADSVAAARTQAKAAQHKTHELRSTVQGETRVISARTAQTRAVRDELVGAQNDLSGQRRTKLVALSKLSDTERAEAEEIDSLQAASNALAARIRAAQANNGTPTTPSAAGLIWPVSGPITSPFGWRWGRMHQGIDIGVSMGTPIHAAAAGTIIYCGWEEGYGNLVVIDHGGDLATAYGHQSAIAVTCGQYVSQGQVIGYVGCTGHCTGPHLHFEVRVNGDPVDPLGYLP